MTTTEKVSLRGNEVAVAIPLLTIRKCLYATHRRFAPRGNASLLVYDLPHIKHFLDLNIIYNIIKMMKPLYINLDEKDFKEKIEILFDILNECSLCPNDCKVNRNKGEKGRCESDSKIKISGFHLHFGEEPPISGRNGSGTIFFSGCPSKCVYCQNYTISQLCEGYYINVEQLFSIMLKLQMEGAHNINLVTPTHYVPQIVNAIFLARNSGLKIPIVYNTFGYEKVETLRILEGIIDIYMPDMRYSDDKYAQKYSGVKDYTYYNRIAVKEMHRQVGDLSIENGIAIKGLLVRLLILPNDVSGTIDTLNFLYEEVSKDTYISLLDQYHPVYKAYKFKEINRTIEEDEYMKIYKVAKKFRGHFQMSRIGKLYDL